MKAFVYDLSSDRLPEEVEPNSVDVITLIFVFSALSPDQWQNALSNVFNVRLP
jgi:tRNAThr (cytosine32-N3)-methyltransferase